MKPSQSCCTGPAIIIQTILSIFSPTFTSAILLFVTQGPSLLRMQMSECIMRWTPINITIIDWESDSRPDRSYRSDLASYSDIISSPVQGLLRPALFIFIETRNCRHWRLSCVVMSGHANIVILGIEKYGIDCHDSYDKVKVFRHFSWTRHLKSVPSAWHKWPMHRKNLL